MRAECVSVRAVPDADEAAMTGRGNSLVEKNDRRFNQRRIEAGYDGGEFIPVRDVERGGGRGTWSRLRTGAPLEGIGMIFGIAGQQSGGLGGIFLVDDGVRR